MAKTGYLTAMRRESLKTFFEASPTARLLRSDLAPLVIDFLNQTFKTGDTISIGQADLRTRLTCFQEELHAIDPLTMVGAADLYLTKWSEAGWLQRFLESNSTEPQYQLTRHAEEAIRFVDAAIVKNKSLVGTESRLRLVIETLEDLVRGASADPNRRLEYLRSERDRIDREIASIEAGKSIQVYRPAQIRERFQTAVDLLKTLQSDFRAVEERFQSIARDVQQLQASGHDTRGSILGYALDAEDLLKQQDEGISFFAFVAFLISPSQQASLRKSIEEVQQLAELADQHESLARVRRMVPSLLAEADKVMRTTARLSSTLEAVAGCSSGRASSSVGECSKRDQASRAEPSELAADNFGALRCYGRSGSCFTAGKDLLDTQHDLRSSATRSARDGLDASASGRGCVRAIASARFSQAQANDSRRHVQWQQRDAGRVA